MSRLIRYFLSVSTAVLLSLAWLGLPGWFLFVALLPFLALENFFVQNKNEFKSVVFWWHSFLTFLIWNGITTWWIAYATVAGAILAIVTNSFLMSLVWWLGHIARRRFNESLGYVAIAVFWISFEYFHFHWDIAWPWLSLGNGFANNVRMIQWYEYTGVLGGTAWVLAVNIGIFSISQRLQNFISRRRVIGTAAITFLIITVPWIYSNSVYKSYTEKENPVNVVIVQPNIDPYNEDYDIQAENEKLNKFLSLAGSKTNDETDLVIGPETIFERSFDWNIDHLELNMQYREMYRWMMSYPNAELLFGTSSSRIYRDAGRATETARKSNELYFDVFNSAIFINREGKGDVYHKSILVPGVEKMPFRKYLGFLTDWVIDLGGTTGSLGRQDEPSNFKLKSGDEVAPAICYESVFGGYLTRFVQKGAGLIVVITNDGWWRNTAGYRQHLSYSRLRAIETRRSVARSANTGISCFVNQRGDLSEVTGWWEDAAIESKVNLNDEITFYVKNGDYIARMALFVSALLLMFLVVKRFIKA